MTRSRHIVRPRPQVLPRVEFWLVARGAETFTLQCVEGRFFDEYRQMGYDPYADMDAGLLERVLMSTVR